MIGEPLNRAAKHWDGQPISRRYGVPRNEQVLRDLGMLAGIKYSARTAIRHRAATGHCESYHFDSPE
jgi:hypothetical protein